MKFIDKKKPRKEVKIKSPYHMQQIYAATINILGQCYEKANSDINVKK